MKFGVKENGRPKAGAEWKIKTMATKQEEAIERYKAMAAGKKGQPLEDGTIILLGAMTSGKTVFGLSASERCPDVLPAENMTELDDIAYIPVEAGGLDSLRALRLRVSPKNIVPFAEILGDVKHPVEAMLISVDIVKSLGVSKAFWDSLSKFDGLLQGWLETPKGKEQWGGDKFARFRYSLASHQVVALKIPEFTGLKLLSFHPKPVIDDLDSKGQEKAATALLMDKGMERKDKALGTIAQAELVLGVTGGARELWPKDASLILGLQQVKEGSGYVREILTTFDEKSGLAVKSRFEGILPQKVRGKTLNQLIRQVREFK